MGIPFLFLVLHYWEDSLLKAKALSLNTIQTYVPWNLHESKPENHIFEGITNIEAFLKLCHKLDLVMVRAGPYIEAEKTFSLQCLYAMALTLIIAPPYKQMHSWHSYCDGVVNTDCSFISEWDLGGFPETCVLSTVMKWFDSFVFGKSEMTSHWLKPGSFPWTYSELHFHLSMRRSSSYVVSAWFEL
ncbi:beta-galactosidase 17 isoform X1 [Senna tora]|uniref:beta-galactosidase n=1 Tax=Senna tora TaxID=362788 RepID=A0A834WZ73_9FABA|nr:beta-galactosidase 17 isoform X1 [Senna tora]